MHNRAHLAFGPVSLHGPPHALPRHKSRPDNLQIILSKN